MFVWPGSVAKEVVVFPLALLISHPHVWWSLVRKYSLHRSSFGSICLAKSLDPIPIIHCVCAWAPPGEEMKQDAGPFPDEEDRILAGHRQFWRGGVRPFWRGIAVSNGKRRKLPCFCLSHLHADAMLYHYPEKAGVAIDMLIGTVLVCVCCDYASLKDNVTNPQLWG